MKNKAILAALLAWGSLAAAADQPQAVPEASKPLVIIHAGTLIAVPGEAPQREQSIVVRGDRIEAVTAGYVVRPGARIVDLSQLTVLPGLIDSHVHLAKRRSKTPARGREQLTLNALENAAVTLKAGFTTVRDLGGDPRTLFAVRDAIQQGRFPGPRVLTAGTIVAVTEGHGAGAGPIAAGEDPRTAPLSGICDGPYQCRATIRGLIGAGADVIKIAASGGGSEENGTEDAAPEMAQDEMVAIVETAHALNRKVAAHAHGTASINAALRAGVDSIEHGGFSNAESIKLFKAHGAYLVPTLSVLSGLEVEYPTADPKIKSMVGNFLAKMPGNVGAVYRAGVPIAFGTDAGITQHGQNALEFQWYKKIGMSEADALRTATINAARLLGVEAQVGSIAVGKYADIIATAANPLQDISTLRNVVYVMKGGATVRAYEGAAAADRPAG